jgi:hypothetical protein
MSNDGEVVERLLETILDQTPTNQGQVTGGFIENTTNPWKIIPIWRPARSIAKLQLAAVLKAVAEELISQSGVTSRAATRIHRLAKAVEANDA